MGKRIGIMAMESEEVMVKPVMVDTDVAMVEAMPEQPEVEMAQMDEMVQEAEATDMGIEEGMKTAETLDGVMCKMEETLETGGMEEPAAAALEMAVEHLITNIGFAPKRTGFALEGFKKKETRISATKVAMESLGEKIKMIWKKILDAIVSAMAWFEKFFDSLMSGVMAVQKRAEMVMKAAEAKKGKAIKEEKVKGASLKNYLRNDNKILEGAKFASTYSLISAFADKEDKQADIEGATATLKKLQADVNKPEAFDEVLKDSYTGPGEKNGDGIAVFKLNSPIGDMVIEMKSAPEGSTAEFIKTNISKFGGGYVRAADYKEIEGDVMYETLTVEQVMAVCKETIEVMKGMTQAATNKNKLTTALKEIKATAEKLSKSEPKDSASSKNSNVLAMIANQQRMKVTSMFKASRTFQVKTCNAALMYCSASLKAMA